MKQITPPKVTLTRGIRLFWLLLCFLLPATAFAAPVCGTAPTLALDAAAKYVAKGGSVDYIVTITNNDAGACNFPLATSGDGAGFTSVVVEGTPFNVAGSSSGQVTLRVSADSAVADWTVNVTTLDVDETTTDATSTVNNPLLHNSINMGSGKHSGSGGWGTSGKMYGAIVCQTCHIQGTTNIKRVRTKIITPSTAVTSAAIPTGTLPGDDQPILFTSAVDGSADMGDDSGGHAISDKICEICHTYDADGSDGVRYHAYSMAGDSGHYNQADCTKCHPHNAGFKASCASCHGGGTVGSVESNYWPDESSAAAENNQAGRHLEHMEVLAQRDYGLSAVGLLSDAGADAKQKALCAYCHDNPGADGDHTTAGNAEVSMHPAWNVSAAASGSYTTGDGNCTNICHNSKATGVGSYGWHDAATSLCIMCHNDITVTTAGTTGATHDRHLNLATDFGPTLTCASCHDAATSWAGNVMPGSLHIDGTLSASGTKVAADEYTGTSPPGGVFGSFGSCSGGATNPNACHNDGSMSAAPARAYVWGSTLANDCASCHAAVPGGGSHATHVNTAESSYGGGANWAGTKATATDYDFGCGNCHGSSKSNHLNASVTVTGVNYNVPAAGQCSTNACHHDGQGGAPNTAPTWGTPFTVGACNDCHGNFPTTAAHPQHSLEVGFHYNAIYSGLEDFLPVTDADAVPAGLTYTDKDEIRGHSGLLETEGATAIVNCNTCHSLTVDVTIDGNDLGTYDDSGVDPTGTKTKACSECHGVATTPLAGVLAVTDKSYHVNGVINVKFIDKKMRSKAQLRDEKPYTYTLDSGVGETAWTKTTELTNNWHRFDGYKRADGESYDEQPDTLHNLATAYQFDFDGTTEYYNTTDKTCMVSCHLWENGRVDKIPVHWVNNATGGSAPLMCIDCHTRLPN